MRSESHGEIGFSGMLVLDERVKIAYNKTAYGTVDPLPEEAQASIMASRFGVDLTDYERQLLYVDAIERLSILLFAPKDKDYYAQNKKKLLWHSQRQFYVTVGRRGQK